MFINLETNDKAMLVGAAVVVVNMVVGASVVVDMVVETSVVVGASVVGVSVVVEVGSKLVDGFAVITNGSTEKF